MDTAKGFYRIPSKVTMDNENGKLSKYSTVISAFLV